MSNVEKIANKPIVIQSAYSLEGKKVDLRIESGVISDISEAGSLKTSDADVINAQGLQLLPGLVDLHTHLREPGREDAETVRSGSAAAALGGFTAVHAMANTEPVAD
ncbi:MAG: hypothetical protein RIS22_440, partial [Actinomycetota bacterium]